MVLFKKTKQLFYLCFIILILECCKYNTAIIKSENSSISKVTPDSILYIFTDSFRQILNSKMNTIEGYLDSSLEKEKPESKLGNFAANACLWQFFNSTYQDSNCFVMLNNGSLRTTIPQGEIKTRHLYEVMPFENKLVALLLKGKTINQLFNYITAKGGNPVANLKLEISKKGQWKNAIINGNMYDSTKNYFLITSDYLANGGDECYFLKDAIKRIELSVKVRDALISYINAKSSKTLPLDINLEKRISIYE